MQITSVEYKFNLPFLIPPESKNVQEQMDAALRATKSSNCLLAHFQTVAHILHAVALSFFNSIKYFAHCMVQICHHITQRNTSQALRALVHDFSLISQSLLFPLISVGLIACAFFAPKNTLNLFSSPKPTRSIEAQNSSESDSTISIESENNEQFVAEANLVEGWLQETVPLEIFTHIFSYLSWQDVDRSSLSCQLFNEASNRLRKLNLSVNGTLREKWSQYDIQNHVNLWGGPTISSPNPLSNIFETAAADPVVKGKLLQLLKQISLFELSLFDDLKVVEFLKTLPIEIPICLSLQTTRRTSFDEVDSKLNAIVLDLGDKIQQFHSYFTVNERSFDPNFSNKLFANFARFPLLSRIALYNLELNTESISLLLPHSDKIKELQVLDTCKLNDSELINFFSSLSELESLSFDRTGFVESQERINYFSCNLVSRALFQHCTKLKDLSLSLFEPSENIFRSIEGHETLETLSLTFHSNISDVLFTDLHQFVSGCPQLKHIDLHFEHSNQNLNLLTNFLKKIPQLRAFRMNYELKTKQSDTENEISLVLDNEFTNFLDSCPIVAEFEIIFKSSCTTQNCAIKIDSDTNWPVLRRFKHVVLGFGPESRKIIFDDPFVCTIAKSFPKLKSVSFNSEISQITDKGINTLAQHCKELTFFKLIYAQHSEPTSITYESIRSLIQETRLSFIAINNQTIRNQVAADFPNVRFLPFRGP